MLVLLLLVATLPSRKSDQVVIFDNPALEGGEPC